MARTGLFKSLGNCSHFPPQKGRVLLRLVIYSESQSPPCLFASQEQEYQGDFANDNDITQTPPQRATADSHKPY